MTTGTGISAAPARVPDCARGTTGGMGQACFTVPGLCTAIVDRLTFGSNVIETGTESYRLARTPT